MEFELVLCFLAGKSFISLLKFEAKCLNLSQLLLSPRIETQKNVIIICGCYAWFAVTWQGGHVGGQYNKQCFEEFTWIWFLVPSGDKQFCSWSPTWPLWRHVQTSNAIGHFRVPRTLTFKMKPSAQLFLWKWVLFAWEWKIIFKSKAEHLTSFWYRGPGELRNGLLLRLNMSSTIL